MSAGSSASPPGDEGRVAGPEEQLHRVKVYKLNEDGKWDDKGTGHVTMENLDSPGASGPCPGLVVIADNLQTLLIHRISRDDIYTRSHPTIMTWSDPSMGTDIALSFQLESGCSSIWAKIGEARQELALGPPSPTHDPRDEPSDRAASPPAELPPIELGTVGEVGKILADISIFQRERIAAQVIRDNMIQQAMDVFKQAEDLEDTDSLYGCYWTVRGLLMLNDPRILDTLLSDDVIMDTIGALEYDPELPVRQRHRDFLLNKVAFKEVVPIRDAVVKGKIHQAYRIGYIKDVILARSLDDAVFAALSSMVMLNNVEVVSCLTEDPVFLPELFARLRKVSPAEPQWRELVAFLQEMCSLAKHLAPEAREGVLSKLQGLGLFEVLSAVMVHGDGELKLRATDILLSVVDQDPAPLKHFLTQDGPGKELLSALIQVMEREDESELGVQEQMVELLRTLLEPDQAEAHKPGSGGEGSGFLDLFYDKHVGRLVATLGKAGEGLSLPPSTLCLIVELLTFCAQHHGYRMKYFALRNSVIEKVLRLLQCKQQWLGAAAVRFVRVCVGLKDEFYNRYLVRNNLLEPIVRRLLDLGDRYNLLGSSILEIFDFMAREPVGTTLLNYVAENFLSELERGASYCSTFQALRQSVDGAKGTLGHAPAGGAGAGRQMRVGMAGLSQGVGDAGARAAAGWARGAPAGARELDSMARSSPTEDPAAMRRSQEEAWFDTDDDADTPGSSDGGGAEAHDGPREHDRLGREGASVRQDTLQSPSPSFSLDPMQGQGFDPGEAPGPSDGAAAGMGGLAGLQQYSDDDDDEVGAGGSSGAGVQGGVQGDDVAPAEGGGSVGGAWGGAAMRVGVSDAATAGVAAGEGGVRKRAAEGHGGGGGAGAGTGEGWSSGDEGDKRRRVDGSVQGL